MSLDKMPCVAVLTATYNGEKWIKEQLESIINQVGVRVDIFISDDESTDKTLDICYEMESVNQNITILPNVGKFGGAGKNFYRLIRDVDLDKYDYVSFSDQDDIWFKDKLQVAIEFLKSSDSECYSSNVMAFYESGKEVCINKAQKQTKYDCFFEAAGPGCTYVLSYKSISKFKLFLKDNENIINQIDLHDWLIYAFCRKNKFKWTIDSRVGLNYRQHNNNQVGANVSIKAKFKRLKLVKNKWYRHQVTKISNLLHTDERVEFINFCLSKGYLGNILLSLVFWRLRRKFSDKFFLLAILLLNLF
ncbi:glycosyltransferase [Pantoea sp. 1.19]|uniref:glycosyltransferase n=1 Tax=Pantoea sp. 1.19 TaxID=1925589 RepID=UPI0009F9B418|nr:glycosyltransferase [Pantoea sp. 1.19]